PRPQILRLSGIIFYLLVDVTDQPLAYARGTVPPGLFFLFALDVTLTVLNDDQLRIDLIAQVDLDLNFAAFALFSGVGRRVTQAVFIPHQRLDCLQRSGNFAGEGDRDVFAASRIAEGLQRVLSLQRGPPVEWNAGDLACSSRIQILIVLLHE